MTSTAPSQTSRLSPGFWIFLLAFALRVFVLCSFSNSRHFIPEGDDMRFYGDWALRISHGQWTDGQAFYGLPGYAYCIAPIFKLASAFEKPDFVAGILIGLLQAVFDATIAVLMWKISRAVFASSEAEPKDNSSRRRPDLIGIGAALAWMAYTPAQAFSAVMMPTVWLVCAYYLCLWFAVKTQAASWWKPWLGLGLFVGIVAMLVATILFAVPLLIAAIFRSVANEAPWKKRLPSIAAAIAILIGGIFVGASPAWMHNYFIAHEPVMLSAHSGINFWIGNNPTATGYPKMPPGIRSTQEGLLRDSITLAEEATGHKMKRAEVSQYWNAKAKEYISTHSFEWKQLMGVKFGNFWNAYQYDDLSIIKLLRDDGVLPPGLKFGFIAALGLAGIIPVLLRFPRAAWVTAAILLHMAALLPVFVTERYRLAAVPGLMILGAAGLWLFWESVSESRWGLASSYLALCAGASWFVSIPRADIGLWSLDHYKAGIRATSAGDLERAQRNLETAYAYVPNNADINFALGNVWLEKSNRIKDDEATHGTFRTRAKLFYRLALDLNPRHTGTLNNLGVLALDEKRWALAEKFFAASLETEPEDARTHYLLARSRYENGDRPGAQSALDHALSIRPRQREFLELQEKLQEPLTPPSSTPPPPLPAGPAVP